MEEKEEEKKIDKESPVELSLSTVAPDSLHNWYKRRIFNICKEDYIGDLKKTETENNKIVQINNITKNSDDTYSINLKLYDLGYSVIDLKSSKFKSITSADKLIIYSTAAYDRLLQDIGTHLFNKDKSFYTLVVFEYENGDLDLFLN